MTPVPDVSIPMEPELKLPDLPPPAQSTCWGRVFQHWTQYIVVGADVVVTGVGVYAWSINTLWVAVPCTAGSVGLTVAFVAIGCLTPRKQLEEQVDYFRNQVADLTHQNQDLNTNIEKLTAIKDAIQKEVQEARGVMDELTLMFQKDLIDFEGIMTSIGIALNKTEGLVEQYKKFREMFVEIKRANDTYMRSNHVFQGQVKDMGGAVGRLDKNEEDLFRGVSQLEAHVTEVQGNNQALDARLEGLRKEGEGFARDLTGMNKRVGELIDKIDVGAWREATKSVKDFKAVIANFEKQINDLSE